MPSHKRAHRRPPANPAPPPAAGPNYPGSVQVLIDRANTALRAGDVGKVNRMAQCAHVWAMVDTFTANLYRGQVAAARAGRG